MTKTKAQDTTAPARSSDDRFEDAAFANEYGRIETLRAVRYGTVFSIVLVALEGAKGAKSTAMRRLLDVTKETLRNCDVAASLDAERAVAILPHTDYFGSLIAIRKLQKALTPAKKEKAPLPIPAFSHASFPKDGKSFKAIVDKATARIKDRKGSLRETLEFDKKLFWETIGDIFKTSYTGSSNSSFDVGGEYELTELFIDQVNELIVKEIRRSPQVKGILYFSTKKITQGLPILKVIRDAGTTSTRIYLAGEYEKDMPDFKNATQVHIDDPRLKDTFFTFFLSEDSGYALVLRENWGGAFSCFHTSDPYLVEGLIGKFQREYSLQEQLG